MNETETKLKLRVWWMRNPPSPLIYIDVENIACAIHVLKRFENADLKNDNIICNAGGLEVFEDNEWCEYYDEEGRSIDDIMNEMEES